MGVCVSREAQQRRAAKRRSDAIDKQLEIDLRVYKCTFKILLLGASESGKSTIVKQMKIIHGDGYSQQQLESFTPVVYDNLAESIWCVVNGMDRLGIAFQNPVNHDHAQAIKLLRTRKSHYTLPLEVVNAIDSLWADEGFQECFRRAYEYQLNDSAPYYFEHLPHLLAPGYVPNEQDVLRARVATTGITEVEFRDRKLTYKLVDVGGQRTERRKWMHCFDDVRAVLFVSAINGYDITLFEAEKINCLVESLNLFQSICDNKFFVESAIILFLNKMDLFRDKIMNSDRHLRLFFRHYTGPDRDVDVAAHFIQDQFLERNILYRMIYTHFTTATDMSNLKDVIVKEVTDAISTQNLRHALQLL